MKETTTRNLRRDVSLESIVELVRNDILNGVYAPGEQLKQIEIASSMGVSQGPVREALIRLVSEGLVENFPFRGMFVRVLNISDVQEIYQLRHSLESLAVKLALPALKEQVHLDNLKIFIEQNAKAEQDGDNTRAVEMDLRFHRYIVEMSGNSRLIQIWNSLLAQSEYALHQLYELQRASQEESLAKNQTVILDHLRRGDYLEICEVLEHHMDHAAIRLSCMIENRDRIPIAAQQESR